MLFPYGRSLIGILILPIFRWQIRGVVERDRSERDRETTNAYN
ncbi:MULTISPECIES: hypothetical protein [unclassified Microcoleus]